MGRRPGDVIRVRDREAVYGGDCRDLEKAPGIMRCSPRCEPGANAVAERVIGTLRRDCLDHVISVDEAHLRAVLREYVTYYNTARPHRSLGLYLFANQWAAFKGVNDPPMAWELLKHMTSPPMMRLFPLGNGRFPARRSMLPQWQDYQKREFNRSDADLKAISDAMDHQWVAASVQVVEFGDLSVNIIQPHVNRVFAGEFTARQAVEAMAPLVLDHLRRTAPSR